MFLVHVIGGDAGGIEHAKEFPPVGRELQIDPQIALPHKGERERLFTARMAQQHPIIIVKGHVGVDAFQRQRERKIRFARRHGSLTGV